MDGDNNITLYVYDNYNNSIGKLKSRLEALKDDDLILLFAEVQKVITGLEEELNDLKEFG